MPVTESDLDDLLDLLSEAWKHGVDRDRDKTIKSIDEVKRKIIELKGKISKSKRKRLF